MSEAIIQIEGLRKAYANGVEALKGVDLDIRRGEILALLGPNGAGKTTLINIVCGIVTATGGQVLVDGRNWLRTSATPARGSAWSRRSLRLTRSKVCGRRSASPAACSASRATTPRSRTSSSA